LHSTRRLLKQSPCEIHLWLSVFKYTTCSRRFSWQYQYLTTNIRSTIHAQSIVIFILSCKNKNTSDNFVHSTIWEFDCDHTQSGTFLGGQKQLRPDDFLEAGTELGFSM